MKIEYLVSFITGAILFFLSFLLIFPLGALILGPLQFFYADLYRSCGKFCYEATGMGLLTLAFFFTIISFFAGFIFTKIQKFSQLIKSVLIVLTVLFFWIFLVILNLTTMTFLGDVLPEPPIFIKCASVINSQETFGDVDADRERARCATRLAVKHEDKAWCDLIEGRFDIGRSQCYGVVAVETDNEALCDTFTGLNKARCLDGFVDEKRPEETLSGVTTFGTQYGWNNYYDADISSKPSELWNTDIAYSRTEPIIAGGYLLGPYPRKGCEDAAAYKNGAIVWVMRGELGGFCPRIRGLAANDEVVLYHDYNKIFAYHLHGKLWEQSYKYPGNMRIDEELFYATYMTSGSTGHPVRLIAADVGTGEAMWDVKFGSRMSHNDKIELSAENIILTARSVYAPRTAHIFIISRDAGQVRQINYSIVSERHGVGEPTYLDGTIYVRTPDGILLIDEVTEEISLWNDSISFGLNDITSVTTDGSNLYYLTDKKTIKATSQQGDTLWTKELDNLRSPLIVSNKQLLTTTDDSIFALDKYTGEILWNYPLLIPIQGQLLANGEEIYYVTENKRLTALR